MSADLELKVKNCTKRQMSRLAPTVAHPYTHGSGYLAPGPDCTD